MEASQPTSEQTKTEKGTQTNAPFPISVPDGDSSDDSSQNEQSCRLTDGAADGDIEKQDPMDYDKDTFLVHWNGPNDKV